MRGARWCGVSVALALSYFAWSRSSRSPHTACQAWSCTAALVSDPSGRWPAPRDDLPAEALNRWHRLHARHLAEAESGTDVRLVFLGDSITEGWLRTGLSARTESLAQPACEAIWNRSFGRWRPLNFGIGGDRAQDLGWRLQHGLLPRSLEPDVLVVLIGTNDIGKGEAKEVALTEVLTVVRQLHAAKPRAAVLLLGLLPRGGDSGTPGTPSFHRSTRPALRFCRDPCTHASSLLATSSCLPRCPPLVLPTSPRRIARRRSAWWSDDWNNHFHSIRHINEGLRAFADAHRWATYVELSGASSPFLRRTVGPSAQVEYIDTDLMYDLLHLSPKGYEVRRSIALHTVT